MAANSRFTIWVDEEQFPSFSGNKALASLSLSMRVRSTNDVPIIVERAMWWPQPAWHEAHNAPGTTVTGTRWALAGGEVGGPSGVQTFVLVANTSATAGQAQVSCTSRTAPAPSRRSTCRQQPDQRLVRGNPSRRPTGRFGVIVDSLGTPPAQLVVERSMYSNAGGVLWSAGTAPSRRACSSVVAGLDQARTTALKHC